MCETIDSRTKLLLGEDFEKIKFFKVAIIGVGGVGSIIPIALARSSFKHFLLVDFDTVSPSNLNRQLAYETSDIGKNKIDCLAEKLLKNHDGIDVLLKNIKIEKDTNLEFLKDYDFVFDCIDFIDGKINLIKYLTVNNIPFISSMGMGNKLNVSDIIITKLNKTTNDPFSKKLRYLLKKEGVELDKVNVCFSKEMPIKKDKVISSMVFTPNAAGLAMASYGLKYLLDLKEN